jgi:hypothetical protein
MNTATEERAARENAETERDEARAAYEVFRKLYGALIARVEKAEAEREVMRVALHDSIGDYASRAEKAEAVRSALEAALRKHPHGCGFCDQPGKLSNPAKGHEVDCPWLLVGDET